MDQDHRCFKVCTKIKQGKMNLPWKIKIIEKGTT
jgi:hypothetical protein